MVRQGLGILDGGFLLVAEHGHVQEGLAPQAARRVEKKNSFFSAASQNQNVD